MILTRLKVGSNVVLSAPGALVAVSTTPSVMTAALAAGFITLAALVAGSASLVVTFADGSVEVWPVTAF